LKRLFFGLWPDADTRRQCFDVARQFKKHGRLVSADNLHITLLFIGATTAEQEQALIAAASAIRFRPMRVSFERISHWRKPAVCCLTSFSNDDATVALVEQLRQIVAAQQMPLENQPFQAHVTLLRKCNVAPPALDIQPIDWHSDSFCLLESCSTPVGVQYRIVRQWHAR